jgi:long-chain acyl-CoA synthetase
MLRTQFYADPGNVFVHDAVLASCRSQQLLCTRCDLCLLPTLPEKTALVDTSCGRRLTYAEYGETVEALARGLVAAGLKPGEVVAIFLCNSWEFCAAYHAATLAGGIPTLLNPTYREREVRHQLGNSGAVLLITDGPNIDGINLAGLPNLAAGVLHARAGKRKRAVFQSAEAGERDAPLPDQHVGEDFGGAALFERHDGAAQGCDAFASQPGRQRVSVSGATRDSAQLQRQHSLLPAAVSHLWLECDAQPGADSGRDPGADAALRRSSLTQLLTDEAITMMPLVPPAMNALCLAAEGGQFPKHHRVRWVKSGAAPLAPDLPRRFTALTGIPVCQGYGMTEASPVTHVGYLEPELYRPDSIGHPLAQTECRVIGQADPETSAGLAIEVPTGEPESW